jgi:hypothetical protein
MASLRAGHAEFPIIAIGERWCCLGTSDLFVEKIERSSARRVN